ncbi:lasso peptide biosynthesis B2 protein [Streptomyces sp. NPDC020379]|uniref:lasso peptide biosynthesis B2 protein n=1 Tax=Streptomyces sp. NPDC020379 TaxID=3365071 RepID=UPI0037883165
MTGPIGTRWPDRRASVRAAVAGARVLAALPPERIRRMLNRFGSGSVPATAEQVLAAREAVVRASARCAVEAGCLQRSLAVVLLCRMSGLGVVWRTGVRSRPFRAHAWVEAGGSPVGEPYPAGYFTPIVTVRVGAADPLAAPRSRQPETHP